MSNTNIKEIKKEFEEKFVDTSSQLYMATGNCVNQESGDIIWNFIEYKLSQTRQEVIEDKNARDNRIHKEGFDAGYKKGKKDLINEIKKQLPEYLLKMVDLERILNKLNKK